MAEESPRRPRRRRAARRPSVASREKDPAAAGIGSRFFSLEQRVEKKDIGPRRSRSRRCPPPVIVFAKSLFHHTKLPPRFFFLSFIAIAIAFAVLYTKLCGYLQLQYICVQVLCAPSKHTHTHTHTVRVYDGAYRALWRSRSILRLGLTRTITPPPPATTH